MKLLITKYLKNNTHEAVILGTKELQVICQIDLFTGCALHVPDTYTDSEYLAVMNGLIGTIITLPNNVYYSEQHRCYMPNEEDILKTRGEK